MNDGQRNNLRILSMLLRYPDAAFPGHARLIAAEAASNDAVHPAAVAFAQAMNNRELIDIQAEYVRTFDLDPKNSLYPIWHVYGDTPKQGRALAALLEVYKDAGFLPLAGELPDYLPLMLEFSAEAPDWAGDCLWKKFGSVITTLAQRLQAADSPYAPLLCAAAELTAQSGLLPPEE